MSLPEEKAAARRAAFAARKAAFAARPRGGIERLAEVLAPYQGQVLAGYMPMRTEIDPLWAMGAHEGPVCVPVITGAGLPLVFRRWTPTARMVPGEFGALIPEAGDLLVPRVLIVPLLAFDRRGFRLGYGGGSMTARWKACAPRGRSRPSASPLPRKRSAAFRPSRPISRST